MTGITYVIAEQEKQARFLEYTEVAPGRFRPQRLVVRTEGGRTEFSFSRWTFPAPDPQLFTPVHLQTHLLSMPGKDD